MNSAYKNRVGTLVVIAIIGNILTMQAQAIVWDPIVQGQLIYNHTIQNQNLDEIKKNETKISTAQSAIALETEGIRQVEEKVYNSLKSVSIVIANVKDIVYAGDIVKDIAKYQSQMYDLAHQRPELLIVAVKSEEALASKGGELLNYIIVATTATDANLMNNQQRISIIKHVIDELRLMRGMAYNIVREMKYVAQNGFLSNLDFLGFRYQRDAKLVENILKEFRKK